MTLVREGRWRAAQEERSEVERGSKMLNAITNHIIVEFGGGVKPSQCCYQRAGNHHHSRTGSEGAIYAQVEISHGGNCVVGIVGPLGEPKIGRHLEYLAESKKF